MEVRKAITILRPPAELYAFWHDFERLPEFMHHLERVESVGDGRSHWTAKGPTGPVEWEAQVIEDRPDEVIAWRSVGDDDDIRNAGSVRFVPAPGDRGTEVHVRIHYEAPGGKIGATFAKMLGEEPGEQLADDLRRFKQVMELGEVVRSTAAPEGAGRKIPRQKAAGGDEDDVEMRRRAS